MGKPGRVDKDNVVQMARDGFSVAEIADANSCKPNYVLRILNNAGIHLFKPKVDTGKIRALAKARWSIEDIAEDCECTIEEVKACLQ